MGCRNPYRISVDPATSIVYWGEIGPDAGNDGVQGPRGYDEINQAKKAGNYGWPYFVGDSKPYHQYDFASKKVSDLFEPNAPINNSPNNTGIKNLPPTQKAMIWYLTTNRLSFQNWVSVGVVLWVVLCIIMMPKLRIKAKCHPITINLFLFMIGCVTGYLP
jgi:hypothetical protein